MAGLMAAAMMIIELALMGGMYPNKRLNALLVVVSVVAVVAFWGRIRSQTAVNDRQFLKSMIPHDAGAILMCNEPSIPDPGRRDQEALRQIVVGQEQEIDQMTAKLRALDH
jgi:uncharacterized protein (DUF305 family)